MSLCWKIYHFFHHKFSKNSNKPPQMHRPVIRIDNRRKKKLCKKVPFSDHRGAVKKWLFFTHDTSRKKSFSFLRILPLNPGIHEIHSQIAVGVIWTKKLKIQKSLNSKNTYMSLCWKIYHFFHHKFSKNSNKPPQMHRPVITNRYSEKKKLCKIVPFLTTAGLWKNGNFSHMTPLEKNNSYFFAFCRWTLGAMKYTPK